MCFKDYAGTTQPLSCLYSNADSLLNKMDEFRSRIADLQPDIIAVTEVLPKHSHDKITSVDVQLNGYSMFQNLNSDRGILLYCKFTIHASIKQNLTNHCLMSLCGV